MQEPIGPASIIPRDKIVELSIYTTSSVVHAGMQGLERLHLSQRIYCAAVDRAVNAVADVALTHVSQAVYFQHYAEDEEYE